MTGWWRRLVSGVASPDVYVSRPWLRREAIEAARRGWEGPRWRTPAEVASLRGEGTRSGLRLARRKPA